MKPFTVHKDPCRLSLGKWKWWDISFDTITRLRMITSIFTDCCNLMFLLWEASHCITKHWSRSKVSDFHHIYALWFSVFPCKDSNFILQTSRFCVRIKWGDIKYRRIAEKINLESNWLEIACFIFHLQLVKFCVLVQVATLF